MHKLKESQGVDNADRDTAFHIVSDAGKVEAETVKAGTASGKAEVETVKAGTASGKALIVTGGKTEPDFALPLISEEQYDLKIASDSGMNFFYKTEILPDMIVGDFDSADPAVLDYYRKWEDVEVCQLNPIKDDTDTEHAIRVAIERGMKSITILGATGTRLDHVLGNITLLGIGLEEDVEIFMADAHNKIRLINKPLTINKADQFGRFVSLLPFAGDVSGLTLRGMKYPLDNYHMGGFNSLGISNEIVEDKAEIILESGYLLVIESRD